MSDSLHSFQSINADYQSQSALSHNKSVVDEKIERVRKDIDRLDFNKLNLNDDPIEHKETQSKEETDVYPCKKPISNSYARYLSRLKKKDKSNEKSMPKYNSVDHDGKDFKFIRDIVQSEKLSNFDDTLINDYFTRIKVEEFNTAFYTFVSIISGLIYHELKTNSNEYTTYIDSPDIFNLARDISLIFVSVGGFFFIISSYFRYKLMILLKQESKDITKKEGFFCKSVIIPFSVEVLLALFCPNIGFHSKYLN
jgi:hypothetical protein